MFLIFILQSFCLSFLVRYSYLIFQIGKLLLNKKEDFDFKLPKQDVPKHAFTIWNNSNPIILKFLFPLSSISQKLSKKSITCFSVFQVHHGSMTISTEIALISDLNYRDFHKQHYSTYDNIFLTKYILQCPLLLWQRRD